MAKRIVIVEPDAYAYRSTSDSLVHLYKAHFSSFTEAPILELNYEFGAFGLETLCREREDHQDLAGILVSRELIQRDYDIKCRTIRDVIRFRESLRELGLPYKVFLGVVSGSYLDEETPLPFDYFTTQIRTGLFARMPFIPVNLFMEILKLPIYH